MKDQFEKMQQLAFGKVISKPKLNENNLKDKIRELINSSMNEAKKKKPENVAPQEDVPQEEPSTQPDAMAPETETATDINPTVKSIQDSLQKAFAQAKSLGDDKLVAQIGNTITMLVRTQVLGQQGMSENLKEFLDGNKNSNMD
jgi:hypothetical protein